jgi:uncharacterized ParB-like nuclease family protein
MAKRQEIPDILGSERLRMNVMDDVLSGPKAVEIRTADIRRDGATQPRAGLDPQHVEDLIQALTDGATLPAIDVMFDGTFYWLFDGYHRTEAHERLGRTKIFANVHQGEQADAQWASYAANKAHGLKRSNEDKKRQVLAALRHAKAPTFSNREIARHIGVDEGTIRYYRTQMEASAEIPQITERTVTRGGSTYTQSTSKIGSNQPQRTTLDSSVPAANVVASAATGSRQQGAQLATCRICHRPLSDPASAIAGVGPCCAAKRTTAAGSGTADEPTISLDDLEVVDSITVRVMTDGTPNMDWEPEEWQQAQQILAPDRHEPTSAAQKRNERIDSVLRRLYAVRGAASEFEELTGIYTHRPAFERVMDAMIGTLEANRV